MSKIKHKHEPFVMIIRETLDSPAWRAMSHGARSLFVALKRRYNVNFKNNGRIFLSQRDAIKEIGSSSDQVVRWFRELQYYGFIVMTAPGHLGVDGKGKAPHWRLTEVGYMTDPPTRDFLRWDGVRFWKKQSEKKLKSRTRKPVRSAPESRCTPAPESRCTPSEKRTRKPVHTDPPTAPESRCISRIPSTGATAVAVAPPAAPGPASPAPEKRQEKGLEPPAPADAFAEVEQGGRPKLDEVEIELAPMAMTAMGEMTLPAADEIQTARTRGNGHTSGWEAMLKKNAEQDGVLKALAVSIAGLRRA